MKRKVKLTTLKKKADAIFSQFIRLRDADNNGMVVCVTCGKFLSWREANAGHYIVRQFLSTRYVPENCHVQCPYCNKWLDGNCGEYTKFLEDKYGMGIIAELLQQKNNHKVWKEADYREVIDVYKPKVEMIKKEKGII